MVEYLRGKSILTPFLNELCLMTFKRKEISYVDK